CNGDTNGAATVLATGGSTPYTYSWDDPASQTDTTATGLAGGTYVATVTDNAGCIASAIAIVLEPSILTTSTSSTAPSCFGVCDGSGTVTASGGTAPYLYAWTPSGCATATCAAFCAGTHTVIVTDINGCSANDSVIISDPVVLAASVSSTDPSCAGTCDGSASGSTTGGTAPYTYLWTDSLGDSVALGSSVAGLCAADYSLTVTDGNGCTNTAAFTITDPLGMTLSLASSPASCGASDGSASVSVTNGVAPYTYLWDDPSAQVTDTASSIAAGSYNVTVSDANGCSVTGSTTVGNSGAPTVSISATDVNCNAGCDGTIMATISGGSTPYTYLWNDPGANTNASVSSLCAGAYTLMLTDSSGCVAFGSDIITEPTALILVVSSTALSCNGACDATATVAVSGGTAPYTYLWDDPSAQPTPMANALCAGTYMVLLVDANGCMDSMSVTITDPAAISASTAASAVSSCGACDGTIALTASGGTGTLAYVWNDPSTQSTMNATGLCAGVYTVIVTDSNGCNVSVTDTVSSPGGLLTSISASTNVTCFSLCDGDATATKTGGTGPFTYLWNDPSAQTNATAVGLCAGPVSCMITDSSGCASTDTVTITEPATAISATAATSDATCAGVCDGSASATAGGGTAPYIYLWDNPTAQTNGTASGLCGSAVSVLMTDANGCTTTAVDTVSEGAGISLTMSSADASPGGSDGTATATPTGGTAPYTYLWDDPAAQATATATGLPMGPYSCSVTDANGCTDSNSVTVSESVGIAPIDVSMQMDVYPNPTNGLVILSIASGIPSDFNVQVQNLIGEVLMIKTYTATSSVNEKLNLGELPNGVYLIRVDSDQGTANKRIVVAR
ncbi:MAG: T9SS type A sorting domain-containing protein, partial [Flavobacteriales bacterium]|nr:T9SS type A sorting domain-containing protein [Flavobacteriales bacterium]